MNECGKASSERQKATGKATARVEEHDRQSKGAPAATKQIAFSSSGLKQAIARSGPPSADGESAKAVKHQGQEIKQRAGEARHANQKFSDI